LNSSVYAFHGIFTIIVFASQFIPTAKGCAFREQV